ncbi:MAG: SIR2 family protein [Desulfohalobiaceae bacterium]|nr:SIR2 family protein [Desulfohalobiaceae bacterium]
MSDIPKALYEQIKEAKAVLFLGSGVNYNAEHPSGMSIPIGNQLGDELAEKYLGEKYKNKPLDYIADLCISETGLFEVQEYIKSIFEKFKPAKEQLLIPKYSWKGIFTTNYDWIIEEAYKENKDDNLELSKFIKNGENIEKELSKHNVIPYFKLHGCISNIYDQDLPLILTPEQYLSYRKNRERLFDKMKSYAYEYPFIFVGHSINDIDIRKILDEIERELGDNKQRSYIVLPDIEGPEQRYLEKRKFTCLKKTSEDFFNEIHENISDTARKLSFAVKDIDHPITKRCWRLEKEGLSDRLFEYLSYNITYVHKYLQYEYLEPRLFYKGYMYDFAPIIQNLDVRRKIVEDIIQEVVLEYEESLHEKQQFILIRGHAGSGKSVLLKRMAWDSAVEFDKLVIYADENAILDYATMLDIYKKCNQRMYLFVDKPSVFEEELNDILRKSKRDNFYITIICAESHIVWNSMHESIRNSITNSYEMTYLNEREIEELISLLERHDSLGFMKNKSKKERKNLLEYKHGRQLLVALHEATLGYPFEDIIYEEYNSIAMPEAKSLYLTVCILHRLNILVRAGLISRVHGISFTSFKENLFEPLENVVFARYVKKTHDYNYQTRHPHIAEMVFELALNDERERLDEYIRILQFLDIDYKSDFEAFIQLTNANSLLEVFNEYDSINTIFNYAKLTNPDNPQTLQQNAIFEYSHKHGSFQSASELLNKAYELSPTRLSPF